MDANVLGTQITFAGVVVALIQWMKHSRYFPWFTKEKVKLVRVVSVGLSFLAGLGIHWVWDPQNGSLIVTGLSMTGLAISAWVAIKQFVITEMTYQTVKPSSDPAVIEAVAPEAAVAKGIVPDKV